MNLRAYPALRHLSKEQETKLLATTRQSTFGEGQRFLEESAFSRDAYIVASGKVDLLRDTPNGALTLATLQEGDLFGEMSFLQARPRSVTAVTASPATLLLLDRSAVEATIAEDPVFEVSLYWAFWRSLSAKLRATNELLLRFFEPGSGEDDEVAKLTDPRPAELDVARRREALRSLALSNMEVNFFASLAEPLELAPGQRLFRTGDPADTMYLVVSGRIMISQHIPGAGEEALTFLEAGELFGEMGLLDLVPRCADAGATEEEGAVILAIRSEVLGKVLDPRKASSIRLLKTLCAQLSQRVRDTNEKLVGWYLLAGGKVPGLSS